MRRFTIPITIIIPIFAMGAFVMLLSLYPYTAKNFDVYDNSLQIVNEVVATYIIFPGWKSLKNILKDQGFKRLPAILFFGMCIYIIGQGIYTIGEDIIISSFLISIADVFYAITIVIMLYATFLVPTEKVSRSVLTRLIFDGLMYFFGLFSLLWYVFFAPLFELEMINVTKDIFNIVFLAGILFLVVAVIVLLCQVHSQQWQPPILWFILTLSLFLTGVITNFMPTATPWFDIIWPIAFYAWSIGARKIRTIIVLPLIDQSESIDASPTKWQTFFPYLMLPLIIVLLIHMRAYSLHSLQIAIAYISALSLLAVIVIRQFVTNIMITQYYERMQEQHSELLLRHNELEILQKIVSLKNHELMSVNARLEALATIDPVTNLPNHRSCANILQKEMQHSHRVVQYLSLLFIDLDHFKAINDGYGHAIGDSVLQEFGLVLKENARINDTVGRWGGEEFIAILPDTSIQSAMIMAERIRRAVEEHNFQAGGGMCLTCSIGVSTNTLYGNSNDDLVIAADEAMYAAKRLGRNQAIHSDDPRVVENKQIESSSREDAALQGTILAFVTLINEFDPQLGERIQKIGQLAEQVAFHLGYTAWEAKMLKFAAYLMDIGMLAIPGHWPPNANALSDEQQQQIWTHPTIGARVIAQIPALRTLVGIVRSHHEHWDGSGYPDGIEAENIPLGARILQTVGVYINVLEDGGISTSQAEALKILHQLANQRFDPKVIAALEDTILPKYQHAA